MKKNFIITLMLFLLLVIVTAFSGGCGIAASIRLRNDMESSKTAYKQCLKEHPDDPDKCEALRRAYEADLKAYRARVGTISVEKNE